MLGAAYKLFEAQTTMVMTENFEEIDRFNETMLEIEDKYQRTIEAHSQTEEERLWLEALRSSFEEFEMLFLGRLVPAAMNGDYDRVHAAHKASEQFV